VPPLVVCRLIQGMGGAMMVPVGRLTLVRTFPKAELVRTMSFVAIPSLVGPLIGPALGGFIISVTTWDAIFYLNVPIGIIGLVMVYLHLPDYRTEDMPPLDRAGLVYFGSGIALLSWVLEVFGEHHSRPGAGRGGAVRAGAAGDVLAARKAAGAPAARHRPAALSHFRKFCGGRVHHPAGGGRRALPAAAAVSDRPWLQPGAIGPADHAAGDGALTSKTFVRYELAFFGYRNLLIGNTVLLGVMLMLFSTVGPATPVWMICLQALAMAC
jgi:MFS family permease